MNWQGCSTVRKVQPVSFNLANEYESELHEFALQQDKYFSKYVKRLIERDRAGVVPTVPLVVPKAPVSKPKHGKSTAKAFF